MSDCAQRQYLPYCPKYPEPFPLKLLRTVIPENRIEDFFATSVSPCTKVFVNNFWKATLIGNLRKKN